MKPLERVSESGHPCPGLGRDPQAEVKETLQKAEFTVYQAALQNSINSRSTFNAVLNEGEIPAAATRPISSVKGVRSAAEPASDR